MKKKLLVAAMATTAVICGSLFTACGSDNKRAMTEDEWKTAFETTFSATNYTMEFTVKNSDTVKIAKQDYESGNYEPPALANTLSQFAKIDENLKTTYLEVKQENFQEKINQDDDQNDDQDESEDVAENVNQFTQIIVCRDTYLYSITQSNESWNIYRDEFETVESLNEYYLKRYSITDNVSSPINLLGDKYQYFTYNSETDFYSDVLPSDEFIDVSVSTPFNINIKLKFTDGKLCEYIHDIAIVENSNSELIYLSYTHAEIKLSDFNSTEVLTPEDMKKVNEAIENYK